MYTVLLITAALILASYIKPKDKRSYKMAILAIFGIAYFCIWRFVDYYLYLFHPDDLVKNISFLILMLVTVLLAYLPWVTRIQTTSASVLVMLFVLCVVPTFVLEKNIKNSVAGWGGYFNGTAFTFPKPENYIAGSSYHHQAGGFSINMPEHWQQRQHKSGMVYFEWYQHEQKIAELRPSCFHNSDLSIAEIMTNIMRWDQAQAMQSEKNCYTENDKFVCVIRSSDTGAGPVREKWHWLLMDKYQQQNIELDVLFYDMKDEARQDASAVIQSLDWHALKQPLPLCVSTLDWF